MTQFECVCLACGYNYMVVTSSTESSDNKKCPKCDSPDIVKTKFEGMFEFTGGC